MANTKILSPFLESLFRSSRFQSSRYICAPCLRQQQFTQHNKSFQQQQRSLHSTIKPSPVPRPTPFVPDVSTFLTLIGRGLSAHAAKIESWDKLFTLTSPELKELGIDPPRARRYLIRWREKFRRGEYGVGGDLKYVTDGAGEIRVVEVPSIPRTETKPTPTSKSGDTSNTASAGYVSTMSSPGKTKLILNVPTGSKSYVLEKGQTTQDLKKPKDFKLKHGYIIRGPYTEVVKGSNGSAVILRVKEGMWEDRQGKKVFGGERRRAETLHKMGVAEHRKTVR